MSERNRIAETLRNAREKRGMSLEQAGAAAGVPLQYVRLLEGESNVSIGVSDELYLIPFFRKYARFVGIDPEELMPEFLGVVQQLPGETSPPIRLAYRPRLGFLWRPLAVLATIAVAVVLMLRQSPGRPTFDDSSERVQDEEGAPQAAVEASPGAMDPSPAVTPPAALAVEATALPIAIVSTPTGVATTHAPSVPSATTSPSGALTEAHELKINAIEEAWLSLGLNDQPAKQYLLRASETRSWSADRFVLTVGNAGGVSVALDGTDLPPIGRPGQVVRNVRLPANAPSPSPTPIAQ
ncbi:MAG: RodZ domain-containing protein [Candidatus Binatia bacterium]